MQISKQLVNDKIMVLSLVDDISKSDIETMLTTCHMVLKSNKLLVLDVRKVTYITSSGWYALMEIAQEYWKIHRSLLIITGFNEALHTLVEILHLQECLQVTINYEDAIQKANEQILSVSGLSL